MSIFYPYIVDNIIKIISLIMLSMITTMWLFGISFLSNLIFTNKWYQSKKNLMVRDSIKMNDEDWKEREIKLFSLYKNIKSE